ncbi:MAG: hypothetical protein IK144_09210 [Bacteroidaceae bacterium]|nr:hypothetical protein [Bacteroidaceae bacterium]
MNETNQLNHAWLVHLANPHHDGTTQQIDDFLQSFVSDNQVFNQKKAAVHQCRQNEDEVWIKSQRDPAVKNLENADKKQDSYELAGRYILAAHAQLPDDEPTKAEADVCLQIIKDAKFRTNESYDAEADKIIQIHQNLQSHEAFLTQIGAWTFFTKSLAAAHQVRELLGERAMTKGEFVKGEMKKVRHATDLAIADIYQTIMAMLDLMPSAELTTLYTQLKGIELYARQYYLKEGSTGSGSGTASPDPSQGGENGGGTNTGGSTGGNTGGNTGGDNGGGDTGGDGGDDNGGGDGPIGDAE